MLRLFGRLYGVSGQELEGCASAVPVSSHYVLDSSLGCSYVPSGDSSVVGVDAPKSAAAGLVPDCVSGVLEDLLDSLLVFFSELLLKSSLLLLVQNCAPGVSNGVFLLGNNGEMFRYTFLEFSCKSARFARASSRSLMSPRGI